MTTTIGAAVVTTFGAAVGTAYGIVGTVVIAWQLAAELKCTLNVHTATKNTIFEIILNLNMNFVFIISFFSF